MVMYKTKLDPYIGKVLTNRYLIKGLIDKGGMGKVYLAEDAAKGGMLVAVKILRLNLANQQMSQRFAREIFIGSQLGRKSQHIVKVLSYGITEEKIPFYVMEYLQGKTIKDLIESQSLSISQILNYCYQICVGLHCAHQGINIKGEIVPIVHRDIKPANLFVTQDVRLGKTIKILDFGIAELLSTRYLLKEKRQRQGYVYPQTALNNEGTQTYSFVGSLPYSSPEQMAGNDVVDIRADIYSLGVVMYEMLTGKRPLHPEKNSFSSWYQAHCYANPRNFEAAFPNLKLPQELKSLVMSCLAKDVRDRPQNLSQVLHTLEAIKSKIDGHIPTHGKTRQQPSSVQLIPATSVSEKACRQRSWPQNKPVSPIVFPHLLSTPQGTVTTLWAMLPQREITQIQVNNIGTEFMAEFISYPMLLWVTLLCDRNCSPRWLSSFFDLKDARGEQIIRILATTGYYHLLFFAQEHPSTCAHVITVHLTAAQRQQLLDWLDSAHKSMALGSPHDSKTLLKAKYELKKPEILAKLTVNQHQQSVGMKAWMSRLWPKFQNLY